MADKKLISIIAPMYNEETLVDKYCNVTLEALHPLKMKYDIEIVLVDDGSKDNTLRLMKSQQLKYPNTISIVRLSRNFGLEGAVSAGLKTATGDAVVVMDADLQDPPALILQMVAEWENGADIVIGNRIERKYDNFFKKSTANMYYKILDSLSGKIKLEKSAANYRLLDRKAVNLINALPEVNGVFRVVVPFVGMETHAVDYSREKRISGETKYNLKSMIRYALDSITGISIEPLRKIFLLVPLSFVFSTVFFIFGLFTDNTSKIVFFIGSIIGLFFTILFVCLSLIAEYIGQIMIETKKRPNSIITEYLPSNVSKELSNELY